MLSFSQLSAFFKGFKLNVAHSHFYFFYGMRTYNIFFSTFKLTKALRNRIDVSVVEIFSHDFVVFFLSVHNCGIVLAYEVRSQNISVLLTIPFDDAIFIKALRSVWIFAWNACWVISFFLCVGMIDGHVVRMFRMRVMILHLWTGS